MNTDVQAYRCRRIATRYEKTAANFAAMVANAAIALWLR